MKDELGGKMTTRLAQLRPNTSNYSTDDSDENKKVKGVKMCVVRGKLKFKDYKHCLEATHLKN